MLPWWTSALVGDLEQIIDAAISTAGADFGNIQLLDGQGVLRIVAQRNFPAWWIEFWEVQAQGQGACGRALANNQQVIVEDVEQSPIFRGTPALQVQRRAGVRAVHSIPLMNRLGECCGMFSTHYRQRHLPSPQVQSTLVLLAAHAATLVERALEEHRRLEGEARLARASYLLDAVTEGAELLIATVDREMRYTYFNRRHHTEVQRLTGKSTTLGMSLPEVLAGFPQELAQALAIWGRALRGETVVTQLSYGQAERYQRWYEARHTPIRNAQGEIVGAGEVTADVSGRVAAEQALRAKDRELADQRHLLQSIVQTTDVMLALLDRSQRVVWVNEAFAQGFGARAEELAGRDLFSMYPAPDIEAVFRQVREEGISAFHKDHTGYMRHLPNHDNRHWDWSLAPVRDASGRITGLVYSLRDTTPFRQAELALASSEQRYRGLLEQVPDGIFVAEADGRMTDVNPGGAQMTGYAPQEIVGMDIHQLLWPQEVSRLPKELARLEDGTVVRSEWRFQRKDGSTFFGEVLGRRLADGRLQGVLRDISERRQDETKRLEALTRQRDALLREVHHRIKNHLHGVIGLLSAEATVHPGLQAHLADVASQIRAIATVHGLQAHPQREEVDLVQVVERLAATAVGPVPVRCSLHVAGPIGVGENASISLALVVNELIANALKHLERADPDRPVRVELTQDDGALRLDVCDGPAHLPAGFDFDRQRGLGLGLELVGTLLPREGARLAYEQRDDEVCATLWLRSPAVSWPDGG